MIEFNDRTSIRKKYLLNLDNFSIIQKISVGGFGSVYSIKDKNSKIEYAAKVLHSEEGGEQNKQMINREIGIMMRLHHPSVIQLYDAYSLQDFEGQNNVTIVMNLCKNGTLAKHIQQVQRGLSDVFINNTIRQKILIGIARGMMYLHQNRVIHRDLKPGNILLDENFNPIITDFGLSKIFEKGNSQKQTQSYGTFTYMAPEVIKGDKYNGKADVYSFALLMYEVVTDLEPYPSFQSGSMSLYKFNNKVVDEKYRPEFTVPIKESLKNLIEQCWSDDPKERPTFEEIFNKLAFNLEDSIYDVFEDDNDYKYYLDDVDVEEILSYAYNIIDSENTNSTNVGKEQMKRQLDDQSKLIDKLSTDNDQLKKKVCEYERMVKKLSDENNEIKSRLSNLEQIVNKNKKDNDNEDKIKDTRKELQEDRKNFVPIAKDSQDNFSGEEVLMHVITRLHKLVKYECKKEESPDYKKSDSEKKEQTKIFYCHQGDGILSFICNKEHNLYKIVLTERGTEAVILNQCVFVEMNPKKITKNKIQFFGKDNEGKLDILILVFVHETECDDFLSLWQKIINDLK